MDLLAFRGPFRLDLGSGGLFENPRIFRGRLDERELIRGAIPAGATDDAVGRILVRFLGEAPEVVQIGVKGPLQDLLFLRRKLAPFFQGNGVAIQAEMHRQGIIVAAVVQPAGKPGGGNAGDGAIHQADGQGVPGVAEGDFTG